MSHGQGHISLDQVAQIPIQPDLEHFQGGGIHNFFGQPVPLPHHPHHKKTDYVVTIQVIKL